MGLAQLLKPMRRADLEVEEEHAWFNRGKSCTSLSRHTHYTQVINKVLFQYAARHAPLRIEDLVASVQSNSVEVESIDAEM
jgi:hypothetical protein